MKKKISSLFCFVATFAMLMCVTFIYSCSKDEFEEQNDVPPIVPGDTIPSQPNDSTDIIPEVRGYYEISKEYIEGWDYGILTTDKHYLLVRKDTASNVYECYMNDSVNSTMGVAAYLDAECKLTKLIFTEGVFNIQYDDSLNQAYISFADSTGGIVAEEVIDLPSQSNTRSFMLTRSVASTVGDVIQGIIDGKGYIDNLGTLGDFVSGDWENAFTDLGIDATAGLIGGVVAGLPGAIAGFVIGEMINYLRDQGEKSDEMGVQLLLGDANVQIYDVKRTGIYTYKVKVVASRLFTSNQNVSFRIGLYVRENFNTVNEKYHSIATERYAVAGDGTIEFDVKTTNANGTYFAVPVLFPYRQYSTGGVTELFGYKRYGGVVKLEGDICQVNSVTPGKCVKNGSDYKFDLKTSASLICTEDVRSWGVDLYVYQVLDDYIEQKVGTIDYPLSTSSYTLSFEGSVPERFLYEDDKHFDMRAVPFAISDRGERVEGDAQTFTLKAEGCGCTDDNHPHKIDLGLSSGTLWACCNIGADSPEDYGDYFAWGETSPKSVYSWYTYKYWNDTDGDGYWDSNEITNIGSNISGTQYDAATANWGGEWCMPTYDQITELKSRCTWTWTTQNGVKGYKVTGPNGNCIFLPAAGYRFGSNLYDAGSSGYYWSSCYYWPSLKYVDSPDGAWNLGFGYRGDLYFVQYRSYGHSVRAVVR